MLQILDCIPTTVHYCLLSIPPDLYTSAGTDKIELLFPRTGVLNSRDYTISPRGRPSAHVRPYTRIVAGYTVADAGLINNFERSHIFLLLLFVLGHQF